MNPLLRLSQFGQSVWLDDLRRKSNPTITVSRAHPLLRARPAARKPCAGEPLADGGGGGLGSGLAALLLLACGCASVGPSSIVRDRFDYAAAISDSWKTQMLTNMVRIR
jgi:hypothetical protein